MLPREHLYTPINIYEGLEIKTMIFFALAVCVGIYERYVSFLDAARYGWLLCHVEQSITT